MQDYVKLCQIVDTIKLHYYHGDSTTQTMFNEYLKIVDGFKLLKDDAQTVHHTNNDMRFVNTTIGGSRFRVMATTFRGFSVTLKNMDVTISFKTLNPRYSDEMLHDEYLTLTQNPIIKVEFRASYLARVGHDSAIRFVNRLIEHHILSDYKIKVSELHLATDVQGYDFEMMDYYRFKTRKRSNAMHDEDSKTNSYYYSGRKFTGFTFGTGDEMLRIYNKSVEIKKNPDKEFIRYFAWENNQDYKPDLEVWRIEIQYRREKLKKIYDSENGLLDGFTNVLDSIPSLWNRALEQISFHDLSHDYCMDAMLGYQIINDQKYSIKFETIRKRIQRSIVHPLWDFLKGWLGYEANETNVYEAPKTSAFQWVSNSIKSLFSTLLKHSGELSPEILETAFKRADDEIIKNKQLTLMDNAYANTLEYLGTVKTAYQELGFTTMGIGTKTDETGVRSPYHQLELNASMYVREIARGIFNDRQFTFDENLNRSRILIKSLEKNIA